MRTRMRAWRSTSPWSYAIRTRRSSRTCVPGRARSGAAGHEVQAEDDVLRRHDDRLPCAGERMLWWTFMSVRASTCASTDSGTWTAIWSRRSRRCSRADEGVQLDGLALDEGIGSNALDAEPNGASGRGSGGWACSRITSSRMSQTSDALSDHLLGALDGRDVPALLELVVDDGLNSSSPSSSQPALVESELGPTTITERPE